MEPTKTGEPRFDLTAGRLQGWTGPDGEQGGCCGISVTIEPLTSDARNTIIAYLTDHPLELYSLLAGREAPWLAGFVPSPLPGEGEGVPCTCGREACGQAAAVLDAARQKLAAEPLQLLALLGLPREALLAGVFDAWAKAVPPRPGGAAGDAATRVKEKGPSGPSPGEWVAEAAAEGRLHRPGPQLGELAVPLSPPPPGELGPAGDWAGLLPGVSGVTQALGLIARAASERAEQKRRRIEQP
ncbi:hypothetical protein NST44_02080 [Paenibacillus sp. FSL W8-0919]|uniref:hypothetical protein n=1 Tax=Paenibacillus sp. FSL W8-0919 TaxID=2954707 RepID=UPI0030F84397